MTPAIVVLDQISKVFGPQKVLNSISLNLAPGKFYALLGKNGVGKSTLLKIIMRLELPSSGTGNILGKTLETDSAEINQELGYVSESLDYNFPFNIQTLFGNFKSLYKNWNQKLFDEVLQKLGIDQLKNFKQLSRGQKMQVAFAAAFSIQPKMLILDEITAVLDAQARSYIMKLAGQYVAEGGTVLMATNIISEVQHYAEHIILLDEAQIQLDLPLKMVSEKFAKIRKKLATDHTIFGDEDCIEVALNSDNSLSFLIPKEKILKYPVLPEMIDNRGITAEEIFIYYTRRNLR